LPGGILTAILRGNASRLSEFFLVMSGRRVVDFSSIFFRLPIERV